MTQFKIIMQIALIQNHNELLVIVEAYQAVHKNIVKGTVLEKKLSEAITKGRKIRKSVALTTDF